MLVRANGESFAPIEVLSRDRSNCPLVEAEDWQLEEIAAGLAELDSGKMVEHEKVVEWLRLNRGKPLRRDEGGMAAGFGATAKPLADDHGPELSQDCEGGVPRKGTTSHRRRPRVSCPD